MLAVRAKLAKFSSVRNTGLMIAPIANTAISPMNGLLREANSFAASNDAAAFIPLLRYCFRKLWKTSAARMIPALIINE